LELTDRGSEALLEAAEKNQSVRGRWLKSWRINDRPNGPVECLIMEDVNGKYNLPKEPDVKLALCRIWRIEVGNAARPRRRKATRVEGYWRENGSNGVDQTGVVQTNGHQQPGRLGTADSIHIEPAPQARSIPPRTAFESTDD
jgi:hypothetical protein